ncbi:16140_t:CDS:2, partial [Acaulospora colombiana]
SSSGKDYTTRKFAMSTPMEIDQPSGSKASGKAKDTGKKRFEVKKVRTLDQGKMLLSRVIRALEKIAPLSLAESSWDNVGLLVEPPYPQISASRIFLTVDLTPTVLEEALSDEKVGVIVAYHPPIFRPFKRLNMSDVKQAITMKCVARGIGVFSPHTAVDSAENGVNDWLARGLGSGFSRTIVPAENPPPGQERAGMGRIFTFHQAVPLSTVIDRVKRHLKLPYVRVATAEKHKSTSDELISTVGICAGAGSSVLKSAEVDLYFTGEMSHHDVLAALAKDTSVILCEHSNTERGYLSEVLKPLIEKELKNDGTNEVFEVMVIDISSAFDADFRIDKSLMGYLFANCKNLVEIALEYHKESLLDEPFLTLEELHLYVDDNEDNVTAQQHQSNKILAPIRRLTMKLYNVSPEPLISLLSSRFTTLQEISLHVIFELTPIPMENLRKLVKNNTEFKKLMLYTIQGKRTFVGKVLEEFKNGGELPELECWWIPDLV